MNDAGYHEHKAVFAAFAAGLPVKYFDKREVIIQQGEVPAAAYVVKSGVIKSYNLTPQGEEKPIAFNLPDEVFPLGWVLGRIDAAQYYYEAQTDCEVYVIPVGEYIEFLKAKPASLYENYKSLADRQVEYQMRINALAQSRASDKVIHTLHFLAHRFGKDLSGDFIKILLPFTQQDMANFMGLARETTAIELKKLEREGVITYRHRNYTIHLSRFKELLGDELDAGDISAVSALPVFAS